jgi:glycosyltransferase involved in cell wall biosynthesis
MEVDLFYFRMPNYVAAWTWEIIRETTKPFFTELHGDWAEAITSEDGNSWLRKITREYRAKKASSVVEKMVDGSFFAMTIGHKLTKYIKDGTKPVLITTNHLLDEKYYVEQSKQPSGNNVFKILFVGDIQIRKGLMYLFKAFKLLIDEGKNVELNIVGSGASESTLKNYVNENKLNANVVFHGRVPHGPLLFEYFKNSNVFVLPSIGSEGVPRVIHEAMAMSCPVIATDVGSVAWQIKNASGILIPPRDEKSIFEAINNLIENPINYSELVKSGFNRSLEFTYEKQKEGIKQFILNQL